MPIDSKTPDFLDDNIRSATVAKEMFAELGLEYVQVHWYGDNPDFNKEPDRYRHQPRSRERRCQDCHTCHSGASSSTRLSTTQVNGGTQWLKTNKTEAS